MDIPEAQRTTGVQVIARAAAVLRALGDSPDALSLGQIAHTVALPRSTVQRIVQALLEERLVVTGPNGRGLRLGPEIQRLGSAARRDIVALCRPILEDLAGSTGETVDLAVFRHRRMVFLDQVAGRHRLRAVSSIGDEFPMTTTANGRAALALLDPADAAAVMDSETGSLSDDLSGLLAQVRRTGLAHDEDEHSAGISAVGFGFRDWGGDIYAISVPVPTSRYAQIQSKIEAALIGARDRINTLLGAPHD